MRPVWRVCRGARPPRRCAAPLPLGTGAPSRSAALGAWRIHDGRPQMRPLPLRPQGLAPPGALSTLGQTEAEFSEAAGTEDASFEPHYQRAALPVAPQPARPAAGCRRTRREHPRPAHPLRRDESRSDRPSSRARPDPTGGTRGWSRDGTAAQAGAPRTADPGTGGRHPCRTRAHRRSDRRPGGGALPYLSRQSRIWTTCWCPRPCCSGGPARAAASRHGEVSRGGTGPSGGANRPALPAPGRLVTGR